MFWVFAAIAPAELKPERLIHGMSNSQGFDLSSFAYLIVQYCRVVHGHYA
jgi:hypothetical protein